MYVFSLQTNAFHYVRILLQQTLSVTIVGNKRHTRFADDKMRFLGHGTCAPPGQTTSEVDSVEKRAHGRARLLVGIGIVDEGGWRVDRKVRRDHGSAQNRSTQQQL